MPSSRETYKDTLFRAYTAAPGLTLTSKTVNVEGRNKVTFLVSSAVACQLTVEWSYDGKNEWVPLTNLANLAVGAGSNLRVTIDDCLTYLRIKLVFAGAGAFSAWVIAL